MLPLDFDVSSIYYHFFYHLLIIFLLIKAGFEASVRSLFNKPVTTAVYALSMLVGVVAMLAFYESPSKLNLIIVHNDKSILCY